MDQMWDQVRQLSLMEMLLIFLFLASLLHHAYCELRHDQDAIKRNDTYEEMVSQQEILVHQLGNIETKIGRISALLKITHAPEENNVVHPDLENR